MGKKRESLVEGLTRVKRGTFQEKVNFPQYQKRLGVKLSPGSCRQPRRNDLNLEGIRDSCLALA